MRTVSRLLCALLFVPVVAFAQQPPATPPTELPTVTVPEGFGLQANEIDFGVRMTSVSGDPGRYQRMRDLRSGPTLDRLSYAREQMAYLFTAEADHVGYRDQHYRASIERFGQFSVSFDWNQIPLFYTDVTQGPWVEAEPQTFRLDDARQSAVQGGQTTQQAYTAAIDRFDTRSRRDIASLRFGYELPKDFKLRFALTSTHRTGEQPWAASFGFSNANELPVTVDTRTNDLTTAAEWSNQKAMVRVAYDGSWFNNSEETLIWDSPLRITDAVGSPSQGREALWPDSTAHTVSASGSMALPARSRAFAYISVGSWLQDADLLDHTINTAHQPIPLARETAEAEARITAMTYRFTSRPTRDLWLSAQYRLYDYDNRTPHFAVDQYVTMDSGLSTSSTGGSEPFGYTRHFFDVDASYSPWSAVALRAGYGQEHDDRTFRYNEETTDRVVRFSVDSQGLDWGSVRLQYDYSKRVGNGLDEQVLDDAGEQTSLRQFDISDRTRNRLSLIAQASATSTIGVNGSISIGVDDRQSEAEQFGVLEGDFRSYTIGIDLAPREQIGASITYGFEQTTTRQKSRQANPGVEFDDPRRDWFTDMDQDTHTVGLRVDFEVKSRTTVSVGYDYVGSRGEYLYTLTPDTTLATPEQLPPVWNIFQFGTVDARHTLTRQLALGFGYRYEHYKVEDFAFSPETLNSSLINSFTNLMYQWRPYETHSGYVRLLYTW